MKVTNLKIITFKADPELDTRMLKMCMKLRVSRSELIRTAIEYYLDHKEKSLKTYKTKRIKVY